MAIYKVTDPETGKTIKLTGDSPPTEAELEQVFQSVRTEPSFTSRLASKAAQGAAQVTGVSGMLESARDPREAAKTLLPAIGAAAFPAVLPAMAGIGGVAAAAGMAGLGAGGAEGLRQVGEAALGNIEPSSIEAARKIGTQTALGAGGEIGGRVVIAPVIRTAGKTLQPILDLFSGAKTGTAATYAKVGGQIPKLTEKEIQAHGQSIADAVAARSKELNGKINDATALYDSLQPEGKIDLASFRARLGEFYGQMAKSGSLSTAGKQQISKALVPIESKLSEFASNGQLTIGAQEARSILADLKNPVDFDRTASGAQEALDRLKTLWGHLRNRVGRAYPKLDTALTNFSTHMDDAESIQKILGVEEGEKIVGDRVIQLKDRLSKFLKSDQVVQEMLENIGTRIKHSGMATSGARLAVAQQLSQPVQASGGLGLEKLIGTTTAPVVRSAFGPLATVLGALEQTSGPATSAIMRTLLPILQSRRGGGMEP